MVWIELGCRGMLVVLDPELTITTGTINTSGPTAASYTSYPRLPSRWPWRSTSRARCRPRLQASWHLTTRPWANGLETAAHRRSRWPTRSSAHVPSSARTAFRQALRRHTASQHTSSTTGGWTRPASSLPTRARFRPTPIFFPTTFKYGSSLKTSIESLAT